MKDTRDAVTPLADCKWTAGLQRSAVMTCGTCGTQGPGRQMTTAAARISFDGFKSDNVMKTPAPAAFRLEVLIWSSCWALVVQGREGLAACHASVDRGSTSKEQEAEQGPEIRVWRRGGGKPIHPGRRTARDLVQGWNSCLADRVCSNSNESCQSRKDKKVERTTCFRTKRR